MLLLNLSRINKHIFFYFLISSLYVVGLTHLSHQGYKSELICHPLEKKVYFDIVTSCSAVNERDTTKKLISLFFFWSSSIASCLLHKPYK